MLIKRGAPEKILNIVQQNDDFVDEQTAQALKEAKESIKNIEKDSNKIESKKRLEK